MSNTQRPTLQKKVTRVSKAKQDEGLDRGIKITIDGEEYEARVGDVTGKIGGDLRRATGYSFMRLMDLVADDPDLDVLLAWVYVSRRIKGEDIAFDDVELTYAQVLGDGFEIELAGAVGTEDVVENPEG